MTSRVASRVTRRAIYLWLATLRKICIPPQNVTNDADDRRDVIITHLIAKSLLRVHCMLRRTLQYHISYSIVSKRRAPRENNQIANLRCVY